MMEMQLSQAAKVLHVPHAGPDADFHGISIDSRTLQKGNLFVALQGPSFDGHAFLDEAWEKGAAAVAVSKVPEARMPSITVPDTRLALAGLARDWRKRFDIPVIGITGSNGKTTVKEMCTSILSGSGSVLATRGNLNNEIGVPLTLYGMDSGHQYAVIEMGANHPGEIASLSEIVCPDIGVITNAAAAHLSGFGSVEGVARAKGELMFGIEPNGVAIINADDPFAALWKSLAGTRSVIMFGLDQRCDVWGQLHPNEHHGGLTINLHGKEVEIVLPLPGRHNAMNAMAAAAVCTAAGVDLGQIKQGLESMQAIDGRLQLFSLPGRVALIDDSYNANPGSLYAALQVLAEKEGERWLVLGDMGELGGDEVELHKQAGRQARAAGVTRVFALGELATESALEFGQGGTSYENIEDLVSAVSEASRPDVTILVKGSRAMAMERVVQGLRSNTNEHLV